MQYSFDYIVIQGRIYVNAWIQIYLFKNIKKDLLLFNMKEIFFNKLYCFSYNSISILLNDIRRFRDIRVYSLRNVRHGALPHDDLLHDGCTGYPDYMRDFLL